MALCAYADRTDESMLDSDDRGLELAVLFDRLTDWTHGRQAAALAEFARRPRSLSADPVEYSPATQLVRGQQKPEGQLTLTSRAGAR